MKNKKFNAEQMAALRTLGKLLSDASSSPTFLAKTEEKIREADLRNDLKTAFDERYEYVEAAVYAGFPDKALAACAWMRAHVEKDPHQFPEQRLLYPLKLVTSTLPEFSHITLEQIEETFEDYRKRLQRHGGSPRALLGLRCSIAKTTGNTESLLKHLPLWEKTEKDENSGCHECWQNHVMMAYLFLGEEKHALELAQPMLDGRISCSSVPDSVYSVVLEPLFNAGRIEEAIEYDRKGRAELAASQSKLCVFSDHIRFNTLIQNFDVALELFECEFPYAMESHCPFDYFRFFLASAFLFKQKALHGSPTRMIKFPDSFKPFSDNNKYDPEALANWFTKEASRTARNFDNRNGNDHYTNQMNRIL